MSRKNLLRPLPAFVRPVRHLLALLLVAPGLLQAADPAILVQPRSQAVLNGAQVALRTIADSA